jgi:hypothetical protein
MKSFRQSFSAWQYKFCLLLGGAAGLASCSSTCGCDEDRQAILFDYTTTTENDQFKVCFASDTSAKKDGVFYYTTPPAFDVFDCAGKGNITVANPALDSTFTTVLFINNGALYVNHHKTKTFSKKYCGGDVNTPCEFWVRYKQTYLKNGTIDTVSELHYPKLSKATMASYKEAFNRAFDKAMTDSTFAEDIEHMEGFDYYGHAEDLLVNALNGDEESEKTFRNYRTMTKGMAATRVYSVYSNVFNEQADNDFFSSALDVLAEAREYKTRH